MNAEFNESDCVKLQFLIDAVVEKGKVYLKFLDQDLQTKHLAAEQNDSNIYLLLNDEPRIETAKRDGRSRLAKLSTVLKYAFPQFRCEFQNIGVSLYAINKDLYSLLFDNLPNYNGGVLYRMKIADNVDDTNELYHRDRRGILQFLLDNSFCSSDLCAVSSINRDPGQIFRYNLLCNNVKEYHEVEESNPDYIDDDDDDDSDRQREDKLRGLFAVDSRFLIDRRRPIHALDVPSEKRCHYWAYWSSDGFAYRNLRDYLEKTPSTNPLSHLAACTIVVDGGRPTSDGPYLTPVKTITVFTTTPKNISFMFIYTTVATTDLREWEVSFRKLYPGQDSRVACEIFRDETLLLSRFVLEMSRLCFLPFSVTFHFLYGYDFDDDVYRPIMGRIMDLKLLDLVGSLSLNIFEEGLTFNDQYVTCDLKQLASLVKDDPFDYEERLCGNSQFELDGKLRESFRTAIRAVALQRLWSASSETVLFATDLLDATVKELFGRVENGVPLKNKISKCLERLVHNDGLEIGRYLAPKKLPTANDFAVSDNVVCKYALSRPPDDGEALKHEKRGPWKGGDGDDAKIFVHVEIADARARVCLAYNASFENVAVVYASRLLAAMGIVSTDEYEPTREILATIDATTKYVLCRRQDHCHELFDATFKRGENQEYTVDAENVGLHYYDSDASGADKNKLSGKPIVNLKQLLDVKDKKRTRIVVILNSFRGSLCYTVKKLLDKLTLTDRHKDAVVRASVDALINDLRDKRRSPHTPVCAAVVDTMIKRVMYDVLESVNALARRRSLILLVDRHRLICGVPKSLENVVESRLQNVFDRLTATLDEKIKLCVVGKYDGVLVIDGQTFAAFENVNDRNAGGGKYRIKLSMPEKIRPPRAVVAVLKYLCDWVFFDDRGDVNLFERLVDLFSAVYVFLFERKNQTQFLIAVRSDDDSEEDEEDCDKNCQYALKTFWQKLINERGYVDGVVCPVAFTPSTMTENDIVNADNFLFHYEDRDAARAVALKVRNDVTIVNYHFFVKRYRKLICLILEKHRGFFDRFAQRDQTNRKKADVKSPKEIVNDVSIEAFNRVVRIIKNGKDFDKMKRNHGVLFSF